jgi:hypothetical protein
MAPKRILLNCKAPVNATCLRLIVGWLRRDHSVELSLTSHWRGRYPWPSKLTRSLPRSHRVFWDIIPVPSPLASRRRYDLFLSPEMKMAGCRKAAPRVHMFHGLSFKGASISPKVLEYDRVWLFGQYHRDRFLEKGIMKGEDDPRFQMIGFPKVDCLVDGSLIRRDIQTAMGLDRKAKTVLYAPTWRGTSLDEAGDAIVKALTGMDLQVIVKLHDHSLNPKLAKQRWDAKLAEWGGQGNVVVWNDPDICPAMAASDLLITDHSSVGNEYTLLDQPIVFFETDDLRKHYSDKQIDHVMIERRPGVSVDRVEAMKEAVEHALENPGELSEQRKALATHLFHLPGTATLRAVEQIYALIDVEPFLPTQWAIDAAHREAAALQKQTEKIDVRPFADRPRTP